MAALSRLTEHGYIFFRAVVTGTGTDETERCRTCRRESIRKQASNQSNAIKMSTGRDEDRRRADVLSHRVMTADSGVNSSEWALQVATTSISTNLPSIIDCDTLGADFSSA